MYTNYTMPQKGRNYPNGSNRGLVPFLVGGALGYGIGNYTSRPNYYYPIYPQPIFYPQPYFYPYYRNR